MATPKPPYIHKVSRTHPVASKMKAGEEMTSRMKMMPDDPDADDYSPDHFNMEETESAPHAAPAPKKKAKTPAEAIRMKRQSPVT